MNVELCVVYVPVALISYVRISAFGETEMANGERETACHAKDMRH